MVQTFKKSVGRPGERAKKNGAKFKKRDAKKQQAKVGQSLKLPTKASRQWLDLALDDRKLTKAIALSSEAKVAAKLVQAGGHLKNGGSFFFLLDINQSINQSSSSIFIINLHHQSYQSS